MDIGQIINTRLAAKRAAGYTDNAAALRDDIATVRANAAIIAGTSKDVPTSYVIVGT